MSGAIFPKPKGSWACCPGTSPWRGAVVFSIHSILSCSIVNGLGFLVMIHHAWDLSVSDTGMALENSAPHAPGRKVTHAGLISLMQEGSVLPLRQVGNKLH